MAYSDSGDGCYDFVCPAESQAAIKDAWEFLKNDLKNTTEDGSKDWDHAIFSCFDNIPLCVAVMLCPSWGSCISYRNMEYMSGQSCQVSFVSAMAAGALCLGPCHYAVIRGRFRAKYGLKGSPCCDCFCGCCLGPCALCSDTNQLMESQGIKVPWLNLKKGGGGGSPAKVSPAK
ncbi:hypothetical protein TSOC_010510 [Tetrabaena socialis]|uniref:Uncharacterized protein n=1 Tax=Tetrabaena socialis TaxID=47790 RepID=A0A2J7ZT29_9CHLO|nr:hypothetical protein TSOC_010510 [Tetrabaena socialis]|eukprot:PNH03425.1 hypothetical protein TSOC_010510 [Tetrabaena socialis]